MKRLLATTMTALLVASGAMAQQQTPLVVYVKEPSGRVVVFRPTGASRTSEFDRLITKRTDTANPPLLGNYLQPIDNNRVRYQASGASGPLPPASTGPTGIGFLTGEGGALPAGWADFKVRGFAFDALFLESPQEIVPANIGVRDAYEPAR
jgi:hypothetical protein